MRVWCILPSRICPRFGQIKMKLLLWIRWRARRNAKGGESRGSASNDISTINIERGLQFQNVLMCHCQIGLVAFAVYHTVDTATKIRLDSPWQEGAVFGKGKCSQAAFGCVNAFVDAIQLPVLGI